MADVCANSMACHPRATCHVAGCYHLVNSLSWSTCHTARCCHRAKSVSWSCHIAGFKNSIRHIANRFSPYFIYFCFLNAVWALTSGGFCIVSDRLHLLVWRHWGILPLKAVSRGSHQTLEFYNKMVVCECVFFTNSNSDEVFVFLHLVCVVVSKANLWYHWQVLGYQWSSARSTRTCLCAAGYWRCGTRNTHDSR